MSEILIDVREYPEYASGHIEGSRLVPLSTIAEASETWNRSQPLTLVCKSGRRAEQARQQLAGKGFASLTVLPGGVDAWRNAGKPLIVAERRPWSMERQVRTVAGSLVVVTLALGYFLSPYFLLGSAFVGAGLIFAGVSDTCMMGSVLARMPWNRHASPTP
jgi:rhodanese-related sulfurtransferase